jgi:hypothetical protein
MPAVPCAKLLQVAARFSPPEMAFIYRAEAGGRRRTVTVPVADLVGVSVTLTPDEAAARLLATVAWPFPAEQISLRQVARILGQVKAAQMPAAVLAGPVSVEGWLASVKGAKPAPTTPGAVPCAPRYRVSRQVRARAELRYKRQGGGVCLEDVRLSSSCGLTVRLGDTYACVEVEDL